jgi:hypothetical protein
MNKHRTRTMRRLLPHWVKPESIMEPIVKGDVVVGYSRFWEVNDGVRAATGSTRNEALARFTAVR